MASRCLSMIFATLVMGACDPEPCPLDSGEPCAEADTDTDADSDADTDTDADTDVEALVVVTGATWLELGETAQLEAHSYNVDDAGYDWSSSDEAIAAVDGSGLVTGIYPGEVTILALGDDSGLEGSHVMLVGSAAPHWDAWAGSPHADATAEAFVHWDEDDPAEIPEECASCHSTAGFMDFTGEDGSEAGVVDRTHEVGSVISCEACHHEAAEALDSAVFPSGVELSDLGPEARCVQCHQGREAGATLEAALARPGELGEDEISGELGFVNIHYGAAAATLHGGRVAGGLEYEGKVYDRRFRHVEALSTCTDCHDPHSTEVDLDGCASCHEGVVELEDLHDVRAMGSAAADFDGDGDMEEGVYHELEGLREQLLLAIAAYPVEVGAGAICHASSYPYFFFDSDGDGSCSEEEAQYGNLYAQFTPRLMRAGYNYQASVADEGAHVHNAKYVVQLLYDAIEDLNEVLSAPLDLSAADRTDAGHFDGSSEAARHWDDEDEYAVEQSCSECHAGSEGFRFYLSYGTGPEGVEPSNGLECDTCHEDFEDYAVVEVDSIVFPSGVEIENEGSVSNLCGGCHRGRKAAVDVDQAVVDGDLSFQNVHYAPAAAVLAGSDAAVGYQYDGKSYDGWREHTGGDECVTCHAPAETAHSFLASDHFDAYCATCHTSATEPGEIRAEETADLDGDGDTSESLHAELETLAEALWAQVQAAASTSGTPVCYDAHSYPYFFSDDDGDGACSESEASYANQYTGWTAGQLAAAFNLQLFWKDQGAWAHNYRYVAQLLIDGVEDMGGDVSGYERP